ncbi:MAG: hypothetical protein D6719_02245 [Candidatus Dadabacteria bacterium]|nr:MAG: hypothetical protein D6719_02245 [Candidatus Dadabacteria bacterium]
MKVNSTIKTILRTAAVVLAVGLLRELLSGVPEWPHLLSAMTLYSLAGLLAGIIIGHLENRDTKQAETVIHELEEELVRIEPIQQVGMMTAGLAHNLRNYLCVLENSMNMLEKSQETNQSIKRALMVQSKCIDQAERCIDRVMWLVKKENHEKSSGRPLLEILHDAADLAELLVKPKQMTIVRDFTSIPDSVRLNDISIMQSIINLVKNAAEASKNGSAIVIGNKIVENIPGEKEVRIFVKDYGCGIDDTVLSEMFEPFKTTKNNGHGIGLVTVKKLVEEDGGRVKIKSAPNKGTEVILSYPLSEQVTIQ